MTAAAAGPFLIAAMGFAAFLMAAGVLTLRSGVFPRWTGIVALIGAICFLITFLTVLDGTTDGSPFGYGVFPGVVALVTWTIATSIARSRAVAAAMPAGAPVKRTRTRSRCRRVRQVLMTIFPRAWPSRR